MFDINNFSTVLAPSFNKRDNLLSKYFLGTGKTTTLIKMCKENPDLKFLVIVYNKSTQQHAENVFPKNAKCKTAHSLALDGMSIFYR